MSMLLGTPGARVRNGGVHGRDTVIVHAFKRGSFPELSLGGAESLFVDRDSLGFCYWGGGTMLSPIFGTASMSPQYMGKYIEMRLVEAPPSVTTTS